jgi:hypothetical protein
MAVIFLEELESAGGALLGHGGKQERPAMPVALPGRLRFVHSERLGLMPETAPFRGMKMLVGGSVRIRP